MIAEEVNLVNFKLFTKIPRLFFNIIGVVPYLEHQNEKISVWKIFFYWTSFIILSTCLLLEFVYLFKSFGNFKNFLEMTELAPCIGFVILALIKIHCIWTNRNVLTLIFYNLRKIYPDTVAKQKEFNTMKYLKESNYLMKYFAILYMTLIWTFNLLPYGEMIYEYYNYGSWTSRLPYFIWYPFDVYQTIVFEINYFIQIWAGFFSACAILATDLLFFSLSTQITMQFDILIEELKNLHVSKGAMTVIHELIGKHQLLIRLCNKTEEIFSFSILVNYIGSSIIICLVGFQVTADVKVMIIVKFLLFFVSSLTQIFVLCWNGDNIIRRSNAVSAGAYQSDWYDADLVYKKKLMLIMMRAQKSEKITAYKFSIVSLESLTRILGTAYSYFTLLRTIYEPNNGN